MVRAALDRGVEGGSLFSGGTIPMRHLGAICLVLGIFAPAMADTAPAAEEKASIPWYRWLFLGEREKPAPIPATAPRDRPAPRATPSAKESLAQQMAEEQKVFLERLAAITQIKKIALDQGDEGMLRKAEDLEVQAEEVFKQRTAKLRESGERLDDRAALERGRDDRPSTAERPSPRRRPVPGGDR